jgi:hypothetical protein
VQRSNGSGFANFTNAPGDPQADVWSPGQYVYEVVPPEGWAVLSKNQEQAVEYTAVPDSRAGLVVSHVPVPVGLAPMPVVSGRVWRRTILGGLEPAVGVSVTLVSDRQGEHGSRTGDTGEYSIPVEPGEWDIHLGEPASGSTPVRSVQVADGATVVSSIALGEPSEGERTRMLAVVAFEDITTGRIAEVPNGVAGLRWENLIATENDFYGGEGYVNGATSGRYVAYGTSGYPVSVESDEAFDFIGASFTVAWAVAEGEKLSLRAWRGEDEVASDTLVLSALGPVWFQADYQDITRLEIATRHYWQFVMDDMNVGIGRAVAGAVGRK